MRFITRLVIHRHILRAHWRPRVATYINAVPAVVFWIGQVKTLVKTRAECVKYPRVQSGMSVDFLAINVQMGLSSQQRPHQNNLVLSTSAFDASLVVLVRHIRRRPFLVTEIVAFLVIFVRKDGRTVHKAEFPSQLPLRIVDVFPLGLETEIHLIRNREDSTGTGLLHFGL